MNPTYYSTDFWEISISIPQIVKVYANRAFYACSFSLNVTVLIMVLVLSSGTQAVISFTSPNLANSDLKDQASRVLRSFAGALI